MIVVGGAVEVCKITSNIIEVTVEEVDSLDNMSTACTQRGHVDLPMTRYCGEEDNNDEMYSVATSVSCVVVFRRLFTIKRARGCVIVVCPCALC